ncbi:MAG: citrate lyase holo-[acyl-carrier protein] synthase [Eubacteriales bacterium]|nr:citrate lyase holo-[acyl-carrier protein] synthase [Eubacteriales bacterium]
MRRESEEVSLREVLEFRERKAAMREEMLRGEAGGTVISLAMNIPGPVKSGERIRAAQREGCRQIRRRLCEEGIVPVSETAIDGKAGDASIFLLRDADALFCKKKMVELEEEHPLGRIWDIDVWTGRGAVSRGELGIPPRRCLICGEEAKVCARGRMHSVSQLKERVEELLKWMDR